MYQHFNQKTKITRTVARLRKPILSIPLRYKEYLRFPQTSLPSIGKIEKSLSEAIMDRRSFREFKPNSQISLSEIAYLSGYSMQEVERQIIKDGSPNVWRPAPSGGGCYPIELYWVIRKSTDLKPGIYHYNLRKHSLELLRESQSVSEFTDSLVYSFSKTASAYAVLTAIWERTTVKYGDRGMKHVLAETGHIMQNMLLVANSLRIGSCPLYGFYENEIEKILGIQDGSAESMVYLGAFGK